jgi:hypothetical protein
MVTAAKDRRLIGVDVPNILKLQKQIRFSAISKHILFILYNNIVMLTIFVEVLAFE